MDATFSAANQPVSDPVARPPVALKPGQEIFGRFTLLEPLGQGRCSIVWRADDPRFAREVALKIFQSANPAAIDAEQKIWRELLRRIRSLNSAHIAAPLEFLSDGSWVALCNPLIGGETLASHLQKSGRSWSLGDKESFLKAIGLAMMAAHEKARIVHGNLHPFNVILKKNGQPRITDFGFHPPLELEEGVDSWKKACLSPERRAGGEPSQTDDLYAFGVLAFQVFTGTNPPTESGQIDIDAAKSIPEKWSQPIKAALSQNPDARPAGFRAFLQEVGLPLELSGGAEEKSPPGSTPKRPRKQPAPSGKKRAGRWGFAALCVFFGLILTVGIGWIIRESALENDKLVAERTAEEANARAARKARAQIEASTENTDVEPLKSATPSRQAAAAATPLKINTGALDFLREGQAKFKTGNASGALESYDLALILQSGWPELLEARAEAKAAGDLLEDAVDEYTEALQVEPTRASSLLGRASIYITLGKYPSAQSDFEAVLAADPQNAAAKAGLEQIARLKSAAKKPDL